MKNIIFGFFAGIMIFICLASTTDIMTVRPAKPMATVFKTISGNPINDDKVNAYITQMALQGYQVAAMTKLDFQVSLIMVKY
jgi:hypothetical protein